VVLALGVLDLARGVDSIQVNVDLMSDGSGKSGGAPGAPPETGKQKTPSWDFKVKVEETGGGAQAEEEAKQRQERRKSLEWKRVKVIAGWLAG